MKRGNLLTLLICFMLVFSVIPVNASTDLDVLSAKETVVIQSRFTNISVFYNDFYITDQGKAVLISSIDARNVDECKVSMYLQKYQNGSWVTVKHWSVTESGTFCGIGETRYDVFVDGVTEGLSHECPIALLFWDPDNGGMDDPDFAFHWITMTKYYKDNNTQIEYFACSSWGERYSLPLYDYWWSYWIEGGIYYW